MNKGSMGHYFMWLQECINWRVLHNREDNIDTFLSNTSFPDVPGNVLQEIFNLHKFNDKEKTILTLGLSVYYIPQYLQKISKAHKEIDGVELFFNKSLVNNSVFPSIETAMFLLCGNDIDSRSAAYDYFSHESYLMQESFLDMPTPAHGEPFQLSTLKVSQQFLNNVLTRDVKGPEFSYDFPATKITSKYNWEDLIVDSSTREQLEEVKEWLDYKNMGKSGQITDEIGKGGYKCLFHGPPGTGKTMAASLIGKLTKHPVYRIDLSAVVSKYVGETEKNLGKVFDRASHGNWILFFDEADALFGKRGSSQNAHDRYANQEVSYLLQRFENYEGVSILATNFKENIDAAFNRRFHSIVNFKKPKEDELFRLWQVHLPKGYSYGPEIELKTVARSINLTGAGIYNVLRRTCMKAALAGKTEISGQEIFNSVKLEYAKENKTLM